MNYATRPSEEQRRKAWLLKYPDAHTVWIRGEPALSFPTKAAAEAHARWERTEMRETSVRVEKFAA